MSTVRKAVVTAAGKGTRHHPASAAVRKEMFPLVDRDGITKPMIQIVLEEAIESGIEEICIVTPPGGDRTFREYFRDSEAGAITFGARSQRLREIGRRLSFAEQPSAQGFGHAVYQARTFVGDQPFLLLLGDHVHISNTDRRCARRLIDAFEKHAPVAATAVQIEAEPALHLYGTIKGEPIDPAEGTYRALRIVEKPSPEVARSELITPGLPPKNYLAHFGMHVFQPDIFQSLEYLIKNDLREKGEYQLTAAQEHLRREHDRYLAVIIPGIRCDAGIPRGLIETQIALALRGVHAPAAREAIARLEASCIGCE